MRLVSLYDSGQRDQRSMTTFVRGRYTGREESQIGGFDHCETGILMLNWPQREWHYFSLKSTLVFQGALTGLLAGFAISLWVGIGAQLYPPLPERTLPLSLETHGCNITHNGSAWISTTEMPFSTSAFQIHNVERYEVSCYVVMLCVTSRGLQLFCFCFLSSYKTAFS